MAQIYKMTMYIVDINEYYSSLESILTNTFESSEADAYPYDIQERELEWGDDLKINHIDATKEDYEEYFS